MMTDPETRTKHRIKIPRILAIFLIAAALFFLLFLVKGVLFSSKTAAPGHGSVPEALAKIPKNELEQEAEDFFDEEPGDQKTGRASGKEKTILFFRNPMNPAITSPVPAKDEMGMDYIPVYAEEANGASGKGVTGMAPIVMSDQGLELSGVMTSPAVSEKFSKSIRTVGQVLADETRIHRVQTRVSGWVEELFVNYRGRMVTRGTPLLSIYSPELVSSQEEYISTLEAYEKSRTSPKNPGEKNYLKTLLDAAGKRMQLFNVPENFIKELKRTRKVQALITLEAPVSGFVTGKEVFNGQKVEPGMELFTVTDLSQVWVEADFYEYEAGELKTGQEAELFSPYNSSLSFKGRVTYIYPYLSTASRTLRARLEFVNDEMQLKPGMFVDVRLDIDLGESLVVPDSAVMYSGLRKIVFVNTEGGRFEPREVTIGARNAGKTQILDGISESDRVAVKANFLLDSESRLQAIIRDAAKKAGTAAGGGVQ